MVFFAALVLVIQNAAKKAAAPAWDLDALVRPSTAVDAGLVFLLLAYGGYALFRHRAAAPPPPADRA